MTLGSLRLSNVGMKSEARLASAYVSADNLPAILFDDVLLGTLEGLVAGFSEQVAVVDENWTILCVNDAWEQMLEMGGHPPLRRGSDYRAFLETFVAKGHENAKLVLAGMRAIDAGQTDSFELTYGGVDSWAGRTFNFRIHRASVEGRMIATLARQDVTDSVELDRLRHEFHTAVLSSQAEARRRLTRELHDSTGQLLTAMGLLLTTAAEKAKSHDCTPILDDMRDLLTQATREIRSMAYLSERPDLSEIGILAALEALAKGFGSRSKLDVSFHVSGSRFRLSPTIKTAIYRVAQEALSNVLRHARAERAQMSLVFKRLAVHLVVADDGIGIPQEALAGKMAAGVGLLGMRSRLAEMGGRLSVRRLRRGTAILASIPVGIERVGEQTCPVPSASTTLVIA